LFWNIDKNPAAYPYLARLVQSRGVDILFVAESPPDVAPLLADLNMLGIGRYRDATRPPFKVRILTRLPANRFKHRHTNMAGDVGFCTVESASGSEEAILIPVHLPAKWGGKADAVQVSVALEVARDVSAFEDRRDHRNTVMVGDFNMNPFDPGMTLVTGLHGLMTKTLARLPDREHRGEEYRRFYNPMWSHFGDETAGPAGTYFWDSSSIENTHWAMLDQVLIRSPLIGRVQGPDILTDDGSHTKSG
jgi:endonuclease/exonuclease/phosphatase family metal-dependent hydrolase